MSRITEAQFESIARIKGFSLERAELGHIEALKGPGLYCVVVQHPEEQRLIINITEQNPLDARPTTISTPFFKPSAFIYTSDRGINAMPEKVLITDQHKRSLVIENTGEYRLKRE